MQLFTNLSDKIRGAIRYKLLVLVLFPVLLVMPIALVLAIYWGANFGYEQLYIKVNTDLSVSHDVFERIKRDYLNALGKTGESYQFRTLLDWQNEQQILKELAVLKNQHSFSYIHLADANGSILYEPDNIRKIHKSSSLNLAMNGIARSGIEIFDSDALALEGLSERTNLPLVRTPRARPTQKTSETRGMMIRALYPVIDTGGEIIAILDAGILLNGNFTFVDVIRDLVYGPGSLIEGSIGTVTVFLDDVRITTNVPIRPGERALGTRVSDEVRTTVLDNGKLWIDRAFVVNDWYISSYEPIIDIDGNRVGMLYAGFLEEPFRQSLLNAFIVLILMFFVLMGLTALVAVQGAKSIFKPLELISSVVHATRKGEEKRIGEIISRDEIGTLAQEFDVMLDLLNKRKLELQNWGDSLEEKVEKRTQEINQKNHELHDTISLLQKTRQKLVVAEKLAALGELTAGVAHEINNPTAVMLGNLDIIIDEIGSNLDPVREEIDLVIDQIYRIKDITNNLLQYARPDDYAGYIVELDANQLVEATIKLVNHFRPDIDYRIDLDLLANQTIQINQQELQQVLINLLGNAIQALADTGGIITVRSHNKGTGSIIIQVEDNGHGMDSDTVSKIFNPFFSTKTQGEGTGLGLSISYGLIRRYGGNIDLVSNLGQGTRVDLILLCVPVLTDDEKTIQEQLEEIEVQASGAS
ncbi:MAG: two-component system NtrC family sensor kinase [Gammaproteobacteria bacterium]|jgi:two-component system NtrC family sensor kinase